MPTYGRQQILMVDGDRRHAVVDRSEKTDWQKLAGYRGADIEVFQGVGRQLECRIDLLDDVILVRLRKDRCDLTLTERIIQFVVDGLDVGTEPRCRVTIDAQRGTRCRRLPIGRHVTYLRQRLQGPLHDAGPLVQFGDIRVLQRVLILRSGDASPHLDVLSNLHVEGDAMDRGHLAPETRHHDAGTLVSIGKRLEIDDHATLTHGRIGADPVVDVVHIGVGHDDPGERLNPSRHGVERNIRRRSRNADDQPGVSLGNESFWRKHIESTARASVASITISVARR